MPGTSRVRLRGILGREQGGEGEKQKGGEKAAHEKKPGTTRDGPGVQWNGWPGAYASENA